jgi:hypothetical protein
MNSEENHPNLFEVVQSIKRSLSDVPELVHSWRFLAGVVYALNQYYQATDRFPTTKITDERKYIQETDDVLSHILEEEHPNGNWLRGFYYNAGVMRLDACYDRIFKAYLRSNLEESKCPSCGKDMINGPSLYNKIRHDFSVLFSEKQFEKSNFGKVRHEVNSLKHYEGGADLGEREQPELLHKALTELVTFLRDPKVTKELAKQFSGKGIIVGRKTSHGENCPTRCST